MRTSFALCTSVSLLALVLAGCASYEPLELSHKGNLAPSLAQLDLTLPPEAPGKAPVKLDPTKPLTPQQVALLAVVNDPELADQRGKLEAAAADVLSAQILPNPSVGLGYAFLVGGPGTTDAWTASISQDIRSIITYGAHVAAAKARYKQVGADALWDVWQVAQKARLLAVDINADSREIAYRQQELALLTDELKGVRAATAAGNLDLTALAPLLAAEAGAQHDLASSRLTLLKDWQDLDALLGLRPTARFAIAEPEPVKLPDQIDSLIASLPARRPDLVALKLGYDAADEDVRAAILGQFPSFALGVAGGSDTTSVSSVGPQVTFDLPIFDHNQAKIASTRATRLQLHAEYQARLDAAEGTARSLLARARVAEANLARARTATQSATQISESALRAYRQGNLSQRDVTDFETTALERQLDALDYERALDENFLALSVELGIGFPQTMPASPYHHSSPQETRS
jgi:outer membrane protein TolC